MSATDSDAVALDPDILEHYALGRERDRLYRDGQPGLEFVRTLELLERFLPPAPADVLDVGGGAGAYAHTLAAGGYRVKLVDPVPLHVEQAREAATGTGHCFEAVLGDARALAEAERSQDVVLLMGPLYHLTERADRVLALREAGRVLRQRGFVFAVGISRYRSLLGGLAAGVLGEPEFAQIVATDLATGQHRNPSKRSDRFTTAYSMNRRSSSRRYARLVLRQSRCWASKARAGCSPSAGMMPRSGKGFSKRRASSRASLDCSPSARTSLS